MVKTLYQEQTYTLDEAVDELGFGFFQKRLQFIAGLIWTADAIEVVILSVIGGYLACDWKIHRWQNALLSSCVFAGMGTGCPVFGMVADKYGRKKSIVITLILLFVSGAASAASPSYYWLLVFRVVTGFSLGGIAQVLTLSCEYVPTKYRGVAGFYICFFWAFGTLLLILLAWVIMTTTGNWRLLLGVSAFPSLIAIVCLKWCPESARYLLVSDKVEAAEKILSDMARTNKKDLPPGRLLRPTEYFERGSITELFCQKYRLTTSLFWYMTFAAAFGYFGIVFMSPDIVEKGNIYFASDFRNSCLSTGNCMHNLGSNSSKQYNEEFVPCQRMTTANYGDLAWTSAAELVGLTLITFLVWRMNRKTLLCCTCIASSIMVFLLLLRKPKIVILCCLFAARGLLISGFQLLYVMTSESFPTTLRATALGTTSGWSRVGGLIIPYIVQILIIDYPVAAIIILGVTILLAGVMALFLPIETRGLHLEESHFNSGTAVNETKGTAVNETKGTAVNETKGTAVNEKDESTAS